MLELRILTTGHSRQETHAAYALVAGSTDAALVVRGGTINLSTIVEAEVRIDRSTNYSVGLNPAGPLKGGVNS